MEFRREGEGYSHPPPQSAFTRPTPSFVSAPSLLLSPRPAALPPRNGADPPPPSSSSASPPAPPRPPPATATTSSEATDSTVSRYHECLRNHAAAIGGHVLDGCGEFMPGGTDDPMKCAACGCHRSFHRREAADGELLPFYHHRLHNGTNMNNAYHPRLPLLPPPPPLLSHHHRGFPPSPIAASAGTTTESSSEELNAGAGAAAATTPPSKKRFRTKFTPEQKRLMMQFAESVEWRIQKQHDAAMEQFCSEIGISRQVLKVWMHNHKHAIRKPQLLEQHPHENHQAQAHQDEP